MDPNTEKNGGGGKAGGKEASDTPPSPPPRHEPAPSEIVKIVADIVAKIERWAPGAQSRVLQSVAAALGVHKAPNAATNNPPRGNNQSQQRGQSR